MARRAPGLPAGTDHGGALGRPSDARGGAVSGAGDMGSDPLSLPDPATFTSGVHGTVGGRRGALRHAGDRALDAWLAGSGTLRRIAALAERSPARDVLVTSIRGTGAGTAATALASDRHQVRHLIGDMAALGGGKFQNLNRLLEGAAPADWTIVVDDDVDIPRGFLDGFVALAEALRFELAQPAQTLASHAAWASARRGPFPAARPGDLPAQRPGPALPPPPARRAAPA